MAGLLSTLVSNFVGKKRQPVFTTTATSANRYKSASTGLQLRDVKVLEVVRETKDSVTIRFELVNGEPLRYRAGQFLTFVLRINGEEVRRAYSFSSCPLDNKIAGVTVKRIEGGLVSTYMNEQVAAGQILKVLGPSGEFVVEPKAGVTRNFVFVAGGSGITPLMSLTKTLLEREPATTITLLYGNRGWDDIIFREELAELTMRYPNFSVHHVLQNPPAGWEGEAGMLTGDVLRKLTGETANKEFYICGPEAMMDGAVEALKAAGVAAANIRTERFTAPARRSHERPAEAFPITFTKSGRTVMPNPGQTVLEAGLDAGVELDYSCAMGGCASCRVKVVEGTAVMDEPNCLSESERNEGYILACVACAATPLKVER